METGPLKALIVDDHPLVRRGLRELLLEHFPGSEIAEAGNAAEAMEVLGAGEWDLVMADINLPGRSGLELVQDVKRSWPKLPVLVVSTHPEEEFAVRAFKLGAAGYVSKESAADMLVAAVSKVTTGGRYISPAVAEKLAQVAAGEWMEAPHETLSHRELQVLQRIATGSTVKEIAAELALSEKTIATYRTRIANKLALSSNVELTRYALKHGLVD